MRDLVFERYVTPEITVSLDDSLTLVMDVRPGGNGDKRRVTVSNGDELMLAIYECRVARERMEAQLERERLFERQGG